MDKRVTNLPDIDPFLLSILSNRLLAVIREMTNTVVKTSRSAVIKNSRDFSCGLLTYDHRLLGAEESLPIHVAALEYTTQPIEKFFDDDLKVKINKNLTINCYSCIIGYDYS